MIEKEYVDETHGGTNQDKTVTIMSDSQSAIQAIANPNQQIRTGIVSSVEPKRYENDESRSSYAGSLVIAATRVMRLPIG